VPLALGELFSAAGAERQQACRAWLAENPDAVPETLAANFTAVIDLVERLRGLAPKYQGVLRQLLRAMRILPSSERRRGSADTRSDGAPRGSNRRAIDPIERLRQTEQRAKDLLKWHRKCARKQKAKQSDARKKRMKLEEIELSAEDEAELAAEDAAAAARCRLGEGADPRYVGHVETLMHGACCAVRSEDIDCNVDRLSLRNGAEIKQTFYEERERLDFSFSLTVQNVSVEKLSVQGKTGGTTLVCGDIETIGPKKMRVTWGFLGHMALLVTQYVMPFNRFARLVSSVKKRFTAGEISRYYQFVAGHFVPIYVYLGLSLADAEVLSGDDTPSLVLEVSEAGRQPDKPPPWRPFATAAQAQATLDAGAKPTMALTLAKAFGFVSPRKNGTGDKEGFNTTTLSGRTQPDNPKSTVVFYRSHFGGLGNLLEAIVRRRRPENRALVVQGDLATVNYIADAAILKNLDLTIAGCASHARRPFALHQDDDPDACEMVLHSFKGIPIYEGAIDAFGRNESNTLAVRGTDQRACWDNILETCTEMQRQWSRETPLGKAARYVIRHFEKLTYYLRDARVSPWNNFSERMLRLEKLIARNSLFRQTLAGRFSLDVMRTVLQTAIAAEVDLATYIVWVMRMPKEAVEANPAEFTPLAFAAWWRTELLSATPEERAAAATLQI
jgi:hypothetical protein